MSLVELSGSPLSNLAAVLGALLLTIGAIAIHDRFRSVFAALTGVLVGTVVAKNVSYSAIVSGPHAENNVTAHREYADALAWVILVQGCIALVFLALSLASKKLTWLAVVAALTSGYAALCMIGWREIYLASDATHPVQYKPWTPALHWLLLLSLAVAAAGTVVSFMRQRHARRN